jgi:hypothetical protein
VKKCWLNKQEFNLFVALLPQSITVKKEISVIEYY